MPGDLPPWPGAFAFFTRWSARGLPLRLVDLLRERIRVAAGRNPLPTAGSIDSQSVKAADTVGAASRGFDGGKKINGRKRHIAVDTLGLLLAVIVTPATVQDRDGALSLRAVLTERFTRIQLVWADGGYAGRVIVWAKAALHLAVTVVKRSDDAKGFKVVPRRWVVERTFGWLGVAGQKDRSRCSPKRTAPLADAPVTSGLVRAVAIPRRGVVTQIG